LHGNYRTAPGDIGLAVGLLEVLLGTLSGAALYREAAAWTLEPLLWGATIGVALSEREREVLVGF